MGSPLKQLEITKNEVYHQCIIKALQELTEKDSDNCPWALPAFGVSNKDGTIPLVFDSRNLTLLGWLEYPLHMIDNLTLSSVGVNYTTGLDLNMGCILMLLDELSKVILTIFMLCKIFVCQVLPQGAKPASNIVQG